MAEIEVADGRIAVPTFVGVLGPVHPGRVVGEVGREMEEVKGKEQAGDGEEKAAQKVCEA